MSRETTLDKIKTIYSHPQPFAQCKEWIEGKMPGRNLLETTSSSKAAEMVSQMKHSAAISSREAAEHYGLNILQEKIEDLPNNFTRFIVLSKNLQCHRSKRDKTSLLISLKDVPGTLSSVLTIFSKNKINLKKLESRPSRKKAFDYFFFIDIEGHRDDPKIAKCLSSIENKCLYFKILGSYPEGLYYD